MSRSGKPSIAVKLGTIALLVGFLMLPMLMIRSLVKERQERAESAAAEVGNTWGGPQNVAGPFLRVPVHGPANADGAFYKNHLILLPDNLEVKSTVDAVQRRRGIFETVVYAADIEIRATFKKPDLERSGLAVGVPQWNAAEVFIATGDLRGFRETPRIVWQNNILELEPLPNDLFSDSLAGRLELPFDSEEPEPVELQAHLALDGSNELSFLPLGRDTSVQMTSSWKNPSFQGAFLPDSPEIREDGFNASWSVPYIARGYPQAWLEEAESEAVGAMMKSSFGVDYLMPVDFYQKSERCAKYALLFIVMTFVTFLLFELANNINVHPMQYLLVGFALCLFYQLLLAFSEHVGFTNAYLVASAATVLLISVYSSAVLKTRQRALILAIALAVMYGVLFFLVQLASYALLGGSVVLFLMLAAFMFLTRNLNWEKLGDVDLTEDRVTV